MDTKESRLQASVSRSCILRQSQMHIRCVDECSPEEIRHESSRKAFVLQVSTKLPRNDHIPIINCIFHLWQLSRYSALCPRDFWLVLELARSLALTVTSVYLRRNLLKDVFNFCRGPFHSGLQESMSVVLIQGALPCFWKTRWVQ